MDTDQAICIKFETSSGRLLYIKILYIIIEI